MSSENGQNIKLTVFGESHASAVGVVIEGLPAGEAIDEEQIMQFMRRRMGGKAWSTPRKEEDRPEFLCGLLGGRTTGAALCARDARQGERQFHVRQDGLVGNEVVGLENEANAIVAVGVPVPVLVVLGGAAVDD